MGLHQWQEVLLIAAEYNARHTGVVKLWCSCLAVIMAGHTSDDV